MAQVGLKQIKEAKKYPTGHKYDQQLQELKIIAPKINDGG